MNRFLLLLILPLLTLSLVSCDDDEKQKPEILLNYLNGNWEVESPNDFGYTYIYDIVTTTKPGYGINYSGNITTRYIKPDESPQFDKHYTWEIVATEDEYYPLIELTLEGELDREDGSQMANTSYYRIEELTPTHMRWHINSVAGGEETINFIRRTDLDDK